MHFHSKLVILLFKAKHRQDYANYESFEFDDLELTLVASLYLFIFDLMLVNISFRLVEIMLKLFNYK